MTGQQMTNLLPFLIFMLLTLIFDTGTHNLCVPVRRKTNPEVASPDVVLLLKQFALLTAVNPFVIGCGNRGGKPKFKQRQKLKTKQYRATDLRSVALLKIEKR
jgi:hypothetical protein